MHVAASLVPRPLFTMDGKQLNEQLIPFLFPAIAKFVTSCFIEM